MKKRETIKTPKSWPMTPLARRGLQIRREVIGEENIDQWMTEVADDEFMRKFFDLTHEFCFAMIWGRPGLDRKTRSMLCLAMLSAQGLPGAIKRHVRSALRAGVTKDEIAEVFLQVYCYAGVYKSPMAFQAAKEVFAEVEAEKAAAGTRRKKV